MPRGVERVARGLVEALERRGNLGVVRLAPEPGEELRGWRWRGIAREVRERGLAGVHSFFSAFPWRAPCRRVQTIHELPWLSGVSENADLRHRLWAKLGARFADAVVCPTEHVAKAANRYALGGGKARAIHWGVGERFTVEPPPGVVDEALIERYRLGEDPFALCLGAVREKKNLAAVLNGLAALRDRRTHTLRVFVTGEDTPQLRRDLGLASKLGLARWVQTLGDVDEADLPGLLRLASVVPVLSRSEGFGLPALEALACGTPVLVPPDSAQAEVAGEHGIVADPGDPEAVANGLARALDEREALRYVLPTRAAELSWDACAAKVEALWKEIA